MLEEINIQSFIEYNAVIYQLKRDKVRVSVYIDSRDAILMLRGLNAIDDRRVDFDLNSDSILIYSLIYGGWLKHVYLSIPHQEELWNFLNRKTGYVNYDYQLWVDRVVAMIGLSKKEFDSEMTTEEYLNRLTDKSENLTKANFLLVSTDRYERYKHLVANKRLDFDKKDEDLVELVKSEIFKKLYNVFKKHRPRKSMIGMNVADALVLCLMHRRIKQYKTSNNLPVIYAGSKLFQEVINEAGVADDFEVVIAGIAFNVVVGNEFLIYKALAHHDNQIDAVLDVEAKENFKIYQEIADKFQLLTEFENDYKEKIEEFLQSRFLQECWVMSTEKINHFIEELINENKVLKNKETQRVLGEDVVAMIEDLNEKTGDFSILKSILTKVYNAHDQIVEICTNNLEMYSNRQQEFDAINDLSLLRFAINDEYIDEINEIINDLFFQKHNSNSEVISKLAKNITSAFELKDIYNKDIIISAAVLWAIGEYRLIDRIFSQVNSYQHYSEAFIHAAVIAKTDNSKKSIDRVNDIFFRLENNENWKFLRNYSTAIAASYVYFQLWLNHFKRNFLVTQKEPVRTNEVVYQLFDKAVTLAEFALSEMESGADEEIMDNYKEHKYHYILNNKIYYITIGGSDEQFETLADDANLLVHTKSDYMQYRYFDTLALYNFRHVKLRKAKKQNYISYLESAWENIQKGLELVISIEDKDLFETLQTMIDKESDELPEALDFRRFKKKKE